MTAMATTHDTIYQGKIRLEQPREGYRFGTDAMLLAASVHAQPGERVLELGCGVGAVLLAAQSRLENVTFIGIEREEIYAALAVSNSHTNHAAEYVTVITGDVTEKLLFKSIGGGFDHVIANPPYYETGRHSGAEKELRRVARQQMPEDLGLWLNAANRYLKPKGSITVIHSVEKLDELILGLKSFCGAIRIFPFWPQQGQSCKRIIVHALKGSKTPLTIMPGLVLHEHDGSPTPRAAQIINQGHSLWEDK